MIGGIGTYCSRAILKLTNGQDPKVSSVNFWSTWWPYVGKFWWARLTMAPSSCPLPCVQVFNICAWCRHTRRRFACTRRRFQAAHLFFQCHTTPHTHHDHNKVSTHKTLTTTHGDRDGEIKKKRDEGRFFFIPFFFLESSESYRSFNYAHVSNSIFRVWWIISEGFSAGMVLIRRNERKKISMTPEDAGVPYDRIVEKLQGKSIRGFKILVKRSETKLEDDSALVSYQVDRCYVEKWWIEEKVLIQFGTELSRKITVSLSHSRSFSKSLFGKHFYQSCIKRQCTVVEGFYQVRLSRRARKWIEITGA